MALIPDIFWQVQLIDPLLGFGVNWFFHKRYVESRESHKWKVCSLILNCINNDDLMVEMLDHEYVNNFNLELIPSWETIFERIFAEITPFTDYAYYTDSGKIWEAHTNRILDMTFRNNTIHITVNQVWQYHSRYLAQYRKVNKIVFYKYTLGFKKRLIIEHFNDMFNNME